MLEVVFIIILQKGTVNVAEDVVFVVSPVFIHQKGGDVFQKIRETDSTGNIEFFFQCSSNGLFMFVPVLEKERAAGILPAACVGYIEHIFEAWIIAGGIDQGDTRGTTLYIAIHLFVPDFIISAGNRFRTLGIDHKLLMVRVFVYPCHRSQKGSPFLITASSFHRRLVCQPSVILQLRCHLHPPHQNPESDPVFQIPNQSWH